MNAFGKGSPSVPDSGCTPSCRASRLHLTQDMMGVQVSSKVQLFGWALIKKCALRLLNWFNNPPQFQIKRLSLPWYSTPSPWMKSGIVLALSCTWSFMTPCLLSRHIGWPVSLSSHALSTFVQNSSKACVPKMLWNCSS